MFLFVGGGATGLPHACLCLYVCVCVCVCTSAAAPPPPPSIARMWRVATRTPRLRVIGRRGLRAPLGASPERTGGARGTCSEDLHWFHCCIIAPWSNHNVVVVNIPFNQSKYNHIIILIGYYPLLRGLLSRDVLSKLLFTANFSTMIFATETFRGLSDFGAALILVTSPLEVMM